MFPRLHKGGGLYKQKLQSYVNCQELELELAIRKVLIEQELVGLQNA